MRAAAEESGAHLVDFGAEVEYELLSNGFDLVVAGGERFRAADRVGSWPERRVLMMMMIAALSSFRRKGVGNDVVVVVEVGAAEEFVGSPG